MRSNSSHHKTNTSSSKPFARKSVRKPALKKLSGFNVTCHRWNRSREGLALQTISACLTFVRDSSLCPSYGDLANMMVCK